MSKFDIANLVVKMICPNNAVLTDDMGLPSVMVYIPAFKNSDVLAGGDDNTHPAFIVNGKEIPGFYYSKYENVNHDGAAYSLPSENTMFGMQYNYAKRTCEAKGAGWHLSTNAEWAAIALWCKKNGFLPYGNNDGGKDIKENIYKAIPHIQSNNTQVGNVKTGTGPLEWSHDKTLAGIWDMNGNMTEYQAGLRVIWGEIQIVENNDAADPNNGSNWKAINAATGALVEPEYTVDTDPYDQGAGATVRLNYANSKWTFSNTTNESLFYSSRTCSFGKVTCDETISEAAKVLLRALALLPDEGATEADYGGATMTFYIDASDKAVLRGGSYKSNGGGIFTVEQKANVYENGFRCAYIPQL